jgi:hypothetical protein
MKSLNLHPDGHPSIIEYYKRKGMLANKRDIEDYCNKFDYDPISDKLAVSYINQKDNREQAYKLAKQLDYKVIEPRIIIKPIESLQNKQSLSEWLILNNLNDFERLREYIWNNISDSIWNLLINNVKKENYNNEFDYLVKLVSYINIKEL